MKNEKFLSWPKSRWGPRHEIWRKTEKAAPKGGPDHFQLSGAPSGTEREALESADQNACQKAERRDQSDIIQSQCQSHGENLLPVADERMLAQNLRL